MNRAFSLVELSIVLVILGLLTGGILAGQSLIRAAELRSATTEYARYVTAVQTFRDKYFALPGDMPNAIQFWGAAHATPATCFSTQGTGTQTCNGNGNGQVIFDIATSHENFRFWQQLANAGLVEGSYSGINDGTYAYSATTRNSPVGKISNSMWFIQYWGVVSATANFFDGDYGNSLYIGGFVANSPPNTPIFKPEEAWNIDTKMDDGKPALGRLVAYANGGLSTCTTAAGSVAAQAASLSADYLLTATDKTCTLMIRKQF